MDENGQAARVTTSIQLLPQNLRRLDEWARWEERQTGFPVSRARLIERAIERALAAHERQMRRQGRGGRG